MPGSSAKRQKVNADVGEINSKECVTFDTLVDSEYPLDLITENLLRLLNYDTIEGLGELLSLAVRSAGCTASFSITSDLVDSEAVALGEQIEASCLASEEGCPSSFPIQKTVFSRRVVQLISTIASSLQDSGNYEVFIQCCRVVSALSLSHIQSLRFVATAFLGALLSVCDPLENPLDSQVDEGSQEGLRIRDEAFNMLVRALEKRCSDVSALIRKRAVADLAGASPAEVARSLFDSVGSVRLAAIRTLGTLDLTGSSAGLPHYNVNDINRSILHVATRDAELPVRKAALRYLLTNNVAVDEHEMASILYDEDEISRKLAAELVVDKFSTDSLSARGALIRLVDLVEPTVDSFAALAAGLEKARGKYQVQWPVEIVSMLITDYEKESRSTKLSADKRKESRDMAAHMSKEKTQAYLLQLLAASVKCGCMGSSSILEYAQPLVQRTQHSDKLLTLALTAFSKLPFDVLQAHTETEKLSLQLFEVCCELFSERSDSQEIVEAVSSVFVAMPERKRIHMLEDLHQDLRMKLANILGPNGKFAARLADPVHAIILQLIIVGRYVDISDIARLPIWEALSKGDLHFCQLARALGMKGDAQLASLVVEKLASRSVGPAVDDILRVLVSAKMRNVEMDFTVPVDVNATAPSSESAWRAAIASAVI